jgi:ubiquinone/menaquinone biosynthesis C-methylase UbiE
MSGENRYAKDWNTYSQHWEAEHGSKYAHLGDEWNDDGTAERKRDEFYFMAYAGRWLRPEMTVLEVGPGGGKWSHRIAPLVKRLIVLDVAEEMLERTRKRCDSLGLTNVEYVLASGEDFNTIPDASIDFFFSYDVFVHIALEDALVYVKEMSRVLVPGGKGTCHFAINNVPEAWERIQALNDWYRFGKHTLGQYYYHSPEALRRLYEFNGLRVAEQHQIGVHCTCIFLKPHLQSATDWQRVAEERERRIAELEEKLALGGGDSRPLADLSPDEICQLVPAEKLIRAALLAGQDVLATEHAQGGLHRAEPPEPAKVRDAVG